MGRRKSSKNDEYDDTTREAPDLEAAETPGLQETITAEVKKGKKASAGSSALSRLREKIRCSMCANPMTMSKGMNVQEVKGKKIPKTLDGRALWESPGVAKGKIAGVLCDDCLRFSKTTSLSADGKRSGVDIKTVIAVRADGSVSMVNVGDLPDQ